MRPSIAVASVALVLAGCSAFAGATLRHTSPGALAFVVQAPGAQSANLVEVTPPAGHEQPVTRGRPPVVEAAWSADGRELVFARRFENPAARNTDGYIAVFVVRDGRLPVLIRRCPLTCRARSLAWSPDGRRIAS